MNFQKKAVGFYTKGKGKDAKIIPITSSSGRFSMSNMTSTFTSMSPGERERKREEVTSKYYDGDRKAFERDVEERPMYVGRLLVSAPMVQKFKKPVPKPKRHFEKPKEKEVKVGKKPIRCPDCDAPCTEVGKPQYPKPITEPGVTKTYNEYRYACLHCEKEWIHNTLHRETREVPSDSQFYYDFKTKKFKKRKIKTEKPKKEAKVKIGKKPKPKTEMTHIEKMHLLTFAKKYELDTQEVDNTLNYYENKKHLEGLAREKGVSEEEIVGSKAVLEEDVSQHEAYLHQLRNELEEAGFKVIEPNN